ncbi:alpha/beta fold hydrolase [Streptomyces thermodiastaticus]
MSESRATGLAAVVDAIGGLRRATGIAGAAIGLVAAGAAATVAVERMTVGRDVRRQARLALDAAAPFGTLRGTPGRAVADDGTELYFEVDEADAPADPEAPEAPEALEDPMPEADPGDLIPRPRSGTGDGSSAGLARRPGSAPVTVVFSHGYCLNQDSWHYQRAALRGVVRTVHWDQRSHGRSGRGVAQLQGAEPLDIDQLGRDLKAVIDAAAPEGPLVLVGHSMGGMTVMALAAQYPELIRERVVATAFVGTSAGRLGEVDFGLPVAGVNAVRRVLPGVLKALGRRAELVEKGRRATADLFAGIVKRYSFAGRDVDPAVARFAERMIESTPIDVVAEFYPAFTDHDKTEALARFRGLPVLVLAGTDDLITPGSHSEAIAGLLPEAELVLVPDAGHLVMLEHPDAVTGWLAALLTRAGALPAGTTVGGYGRTSSTAQPG